MEFKTKINPSATSTGLISNQYQPKIDLHLIYRINDKTENKIDINNMNDTQKAIFNYIIKSNNRQMTYDQLHTIFVVKRKFKMNELLHVLKDMVTNNILNLNIVPKSYVKSQIELSLTPDYIEIETIDFTLLETFNLIYEYLYNRGSTSRLDEILDSASQSRQSDPHFFQNFQRNLYFLFKDGLIKLNLESMTPLPTLPLPFVSTSSLSIPHHKNFIMDIMNQPYPTQRQIVPKLSQSLEAKLGNNNGSSNFDKKIYKNFESPHLTLPFTFRISPTQYENDNENENIVDINMTNENNNNDINGGNDDYDTFPF
jgi:hypothetical protein